MAHLCLVWELGANAGYTALMAQVARAAIAGGHRCSFLVRDLQTAAPLLAPELGPLLQAPVHGAGERRVRVQTSYATLLHHCGWSEAGALLARLRAWRSAFDLLRPDCVVARHSPTALLAARTQGLPVLHYGTGFQVPPPLQPWPSFRPDLRLPGQVLGTNEAQVLEVVNHALAALGAAPLARLQALFDGVDTALLGHAELDHYRTPRSAPWLGLPDLSFGAAPVWPASPRTPRLFVSLLPGAHVSGWLQVLAALPVASLVRFARLPATLPALPAQVRVLDRPVHFRAAVASADAVLGYGSHNLIGEALQAGKPLALMAHNPDQLLAARCVQALGAGVVLPLQAPADGAALLGRWLTGPGYTEAAQRLQSSFAATDRAAVPAALARLALAARAAPLATL